MYKGFTLFDVLMKVTESCRRSKRRIELCMPISLSLLIRIIPFKPRVNKVVFMEKYK